MNIYLVGPITGRSYKYCVGWREEVTKKFEVAGFHIWSPMRGEEHLKYKRKIKPVAEEGSVLDNHGIVERDKFYVAHSDIILANFIEAEVTSIGSTMEVAWANLLGKFVATVMEKDNIHNHAFYYEASSVVFDDLDEAVDFIILTFGGKNVRTP